MARGTQPPRNPARSKLTTRVSHSHPPDADTLRLHGMASSSRAIESSLTLFGTVVLGDPIVEIFRELFREVCCKR